jgi:hypothetical protein
MLMSYDAILRRRDKEMERSWRRWSTAMGLAAGLLILVVARYRASPFSPFTDLPPLMVGTFWIVAAASTWAGWIGARVRTLPRLWRLRVRPLRGERRSSVRLVMRARQHDRRRARPDSDVQLSGVRSRRRTIGA